MIRHRHINIIYSPRHPGVCNTYFHRNHSPESKKYWFNIEFGSLWLILGLRLKTDGWSTLNQRCVAVPIYWLKCQHWISVESLLLVCLPARWLLDQPWQCKKTQHWFNMWVAYRFLYRFNAFCVSFVNVDSTKFCYQGQTCCHYYHSSIHKWDKQAF